MRCSTSRRASTSGSTHPSTALGGWRTLTTGHPAALHEPAESRRPGTGGSRRLVARPTAAHRARPACICSLTSFDVLSATPTVVAVDSAGYALGRIAAERLAGRRRADGDRRPLQSRRRERPRSRACAEAGGRGRRRLCPGLRRFAPLAELSSRRRGGRHRCRGRHPGARRRRRGAGSIGTPTAAAAVARPFAWGCRPARPSSSSRPSPRRSASRSPLPPVTRDDRLDRDGRADTDSRQSSVDGPSPRRPDRARLERTRR